MPQVLAEEFKTIPMSPNLGQSLERAHAAAREQSHRFVLLEHLLFALTEDPEASLILQSANVDPARLGADVSSYLGGLGVELRATDDGEARPDTELLRVLQAAASAAQQSKRRQIDGAIVLAAIVGDGKSPAAGLLKTHGMTFEEAIRALQRANTKARLKPIAKPQAAPSQAQAPAEPPAPYPAPAPAVPPPAQTRAVDPTPAQAAERPSSSHPEPEPETDLTFDPASEMPSAVVASDVEHLVEPPSRALAAPPVQSADEILAAARARIQKRTAVLSQAPDAPYFSTPPAQEAAPPERPQTTVPQAPVATPMPERTATDAVSDAMRELLVSSGADPRPASSLRESLTGAAAAIPRDAVVPLRPEPPAPLAPPPPAPPAPGPFMQAAMAEAARGSQPGGDRHGPLPPWPATPAAAVPVQPQTAPPPMQAGPPLRSPAGPPPSPQGPGPAPGATPMDRRRLKRASAPLPPMQAAQPARKGAAGGERGPLVEAIPRRMRLGFSTEGEVRIAQERIDHLVQALAGRSANLGYGDPIVMRALTVRLKAQDGGFFIEPMTPETQWVEAQPHGVHVEPLTWRWSVTPREAGKGKLVLQVSMRSIDLDGESEEVGPPDRLVEIKVRSPWVKTTLRRLLWLALLGLAFAVGKFGAALGPLLLGAIRTATGL